MEVSGVNLTAAKLAEQQQAAKAKAKDLSLVRESVQDEFIEMVDLGAFNYLAMKKKFEELSHKTDVRKPQETSEPQKQDGDATRAQIVAKKFETNNPELSSRVLMILASRMSDTDTVDDMLKKLMDTYKDPTLADEALDFLSELAAKGSPMADKLAKAKELFNDRFGVEIRSGKNINAQAAEFSEKGLGSKTGLRDLYRDLLLNPRDPHTLFEELSGKFPFSKMKQVIDFVLHSIGADMKALGPSISRAELEKLFTESRKLQAFLSLFQFFQKRMKSIGGLFDIEDLSLPPMLSFELLAKQLMRLLRERYPSSDKVLRMAASLGISDELIAQLIIFGQYRDAMRQISPRLFKSERHRQDLLMAIIEALSDLDDMLDDEEEEDE